MRSAVTAVMCPRGAALRRRRTMPAALAPGDIICAIATQYQYRRAKAGAVAYRTDVTAVVPEPGGGRVADA